MSLRLTIHPEEIIRGNELSKAKSELYLIPNIQNIIDKAMYAAKIAKIVKEYENDPQGANKY